MAEAIALCCIYVGPLVAALTVGAFLVEYVLPAIMRRRARKRRQAQRER